MCGVGAAEKALRLQLATIIKPLNRKGARGGDRSSVYGQNWSRVLLELLFQVKVTRWRCRGSENLKVQV